jgi:hypothetical protein
MIKYYFDGVYVGNSDKSVCSGIFRKKKCKYSWG